MGLIGKFSDLLKSNEKFIMTTGAKVLAGVCILVALAYAIVFCKQMGYL